MKEEAEKCMLVLFIVIVEGLVRGDLVVNTREGRMLGVVPQLGPPFMELSEHFGPYRNQLLLNSYVLSNKTWHAVANGQIFRPITAQEDSHLASLVRDYRIKTIVRGCWPVAPNVPLSCHICCSC